MKIEVRTWFRGTNQVTRLLLEIRKVVKGYGSRNTVVEVEFSYGGKNTVHTLNLGGSKCPTIALSESLDMNPPMHEDSRKNRGKNAPLGIFCQINF